MLIKSMSRAILYPAIPTKFVSWSLSVSTAYVRTDISTLKANLTSIIEWSYLTARAA